MTTTSTPAVDTMQPAENASGRANWGDITVSIAGQLARPDFTRGELAELRRMDPDEPDAAAFWRLLSRFDQTGSDDWERRWGLVLHGLALMTPASSDDGTGDAPRPSAHDPTVPVGLALFQGGVPGRTRAFYSESRLNRLLTSRGPMTRVLLARLFRMLAGANQPFNWRQMATLILSDGRYEEQAERVRRQIARTYYQAERRASQSTESGDDQ